MRHSTYILPDEPRPGKLATLAVDPAWPLLGMMFAGPWLGLIWFVTNSLALGSPTRNREFVLSAAMLLGSVLILLTLAWTWKTGLISEKSMRYASLSLVALRLSCAYGLYLLQSRVSELFSHYGGKLNNGWIFLALAALVGAPQIRAILGQSWIGMVLL